MRFRLTQRGAHFGFGLLPDSVDPIHLTVPRQSPVSVAIHRAGTLDPSRPTIEASADIDVGAKESAELRNLAENLPALAKTPDLSDSEVTFGAPTADQIVHAPLEPRLTAIDAELREATLRTFGLLRWRIGETGPVQPLEPLRLLSWEIDDVWRVVRMDPFELGDWIPRVVITAGPIEDVQRALDRGAVEPLGHELLREAWYLRHDHPRSAFLIGVAALELGVKDFIAEAASDAQWLVIHAPTPPLPKLIKRYLPRLRSAKRFETDVTMTQLNKIVEVRNQLTHSPSRSVLAVSEIEGALHTIRRLLWAIDDARGFRWASDYADNHFPNWGGRVIE